MKIWKTKDGEKITAKEFAKRFKEGIDNITPQQKLQNDFVANNIVFVGYLVGLVALIIFWDRLIVGMFSLGLILIFLGMAYSTFMKSLVLRKELKSFKEMDSIGIDVNKIMESLEDNKLEKEESNGK